MNDYYDEEYIDREATLAAIAEAWSYAPELTIDQLLDEVAPAPLPELSNAELIEALNEFILTNQ